MTNQEILDGNRLIAEFMGGIEIKPNYFKDISNTRGIFWITNIHYNTSWSWLMPVVEKIEQTGANVIIGRMFCEIKHINPLNQNEIFDTRIASGVKINAVNGAIIEFINWYNERK